MLKGTAVPRVVMNSNRRGGNGKTRVPPVANLYKYLPTNILEMEETTDDLPRVEPEGSWSTLLL